MNEIKLQNLIKEANEAHANLSYSLGVYFGYPHCCRIEFCNDIINNRDPSERNIDGSGFIPCRKHYVQIQLKEIELKNLIVDRVSSVPFGKKA